MIMPRLILLLSAFSIVNFSSQEGQCYKTIEKELHKECQNKIAGEDQQTQFLTIRSSHIQQDDDRRTLQRSGTRAKQPSTLSRAKSVLSKFSYGGDLLAKLRDLYHYYFQSPKNRQISRREINPDEVEGSTSGRSAFGRANTSFSTGSTSSNRLKSPEIEDLSSESSSDAGELEEDTNTISAPNECRPDSPEKPPSSERSSKGTTKRSKSILPLLSRDDINEPKDLISCMTKAILSVNLFKLVTSSVTSAASNVRIGKARAKAPKEPPADIAMAFASAAANCFQFFNRNESGKLSLDTKYTVGTALEAAKFNPIAGLAISTAEVLANNIRIKPGGGLEVDVVNLTTGLVTTVIKNQKIVKAVSKVVPAGLKPVMKVLPEGAELVGNMVPKVVGVAADVAPKAVKAVGEAVPKGVKVVGGAISDGAQEVAKPFVKGAQVVGKEVPKGVKVVGDAISDGAQVVGKPIVGGAQVVGGAISDGAQVVGKPIVGGAKTVSKVVPGTAKQVTKKVTKAFRKKGH